MAKTYSLVALLDVLAYRNHLKTDRSSGSEAFKAKLESALSVLSSINETEISYQAISDTIIIAANPSTSISDFISTIAAVQRAFLQSGLLIRGGVAFEQHFKSGNLTYSHALAVAYELEQKQAIYPRVVIDKGVIEMLRTGSRFSRSDIQRLQDECVICVQNGVHFINFVFCHVDWCYDRAKAIFEAENLDLEGRESELAKHRWLQDYIISISQRRLSNYMGEISVLTFPPEEQPATANGV
ncbi:hypothetical protein ISF74_01225 [Burkholderia pseudomallei]|uniref:hypothetical protein n=1 Tax=Burkholderia pseudomallei TaxID=28450 RepID=UPI001593E67E|nr:hypothetical protein [Burkholderia pseudomallei]MBF3493608.1 hypothetical protein [Burkholderia pseudomallei]